MARTSAAEGPNAHVVVDGSGLWNPISELPGPIWHVVLDSGCLDTRPAPQVRCLGQPAARSEAGDREQGHAEPADPAASSLSHP